MFRDFGSPNPFDGSPRLSKDRSAGLWPVTATRASFDVQSPAPVCRASDQAPSRSDSGTSCQEPIAAQLFSATAQAKIWTSQVAMHLNRTVRDRLFRQLDILHDAEEWVDDGSPVNLESYKGFVRAIIYHHIDSRPSVALMPSGNILALWYDGADKLSIEFLPSNRTRWMVQNLGEAGVDRVAGTSPLERLRDVLLPYGADRWFGAA